MAFLTAEKLKTIKDNTGADKRYLNVNKLPDGQPTRIRFVGGGVVGHVAWTVNKKPLRWEVLPDVLPESVRADDNGDRSAKFFIAGVCWDYDSKMYRVVEITQKGLISEINKYAADEDYGDPANYDLVITRTGSGLDTKYDLLAKPPAPFAEKEPEAAKAFKSLGWDLNLLFEGKHPWSADDSDSANE